MSISFQSDLNVISPASSFIGTLGPNATFTGGWVDVSDFTSITISCIAAVPPAPADAIRVDFSDDNGVTLLDPFIAGSDASVAQTAHCTIRGRYARVRYHTGSFGSIGVHVHTLLRKGAPTGSVTRVGLVTGSPDAQVVNGVLFAKNQLGNFVAVQGTNDPYLIVDPPPRRTTVFRINTVANLSSTQLDFAGLGAPTRRWLSIHNDTQRGTLFIRLGSAVTLSNFDYRIPAQHLFVLPTSWPMYGGAGGTIFGIWDLADGTARMSEGA
jgi:hypothetical protein